MMQRGGDQQISVAEHIYRYTLRSPRVFLSFIISYPLALVTIFVVNGLFPPHHFGLDPFATIGSLVGIGVGLVLITVRTTLTITPDGVSYQRPGRSTGQSHLNFGRFSPTFLRNSIPFPIVSSANPPLPALQNGNFGC